MASSPSAVEIAEIVAELDGMEDDEHPDVWIDHESGWSLSAMPSGLVVWEMVERGAETGPVHMKGVSRAEVERLFLAVAADELDTVNAQHWSPGYG